MTPLYLVINLERSSDRFSIIRENLAALGQAFARINAVDASAGLLAWRDKIDQGAIASNSWMTAGAVACALSHARAYEYFLSTNFEWCIVSEDDVVFDVNLCEVLASALPQLPVDDIYFLHFQGRMKHLSQEKIVVNERFAFHAVMDFHDQYGAVTYLVNRNVAKRLLESVIPIKTASDRWDLFQSAGVVRGGWALLPQASRSSDVGSDIGYTAVGRWLRAIESESKAIAFLISGLRSIRRRRYREHCLVEQAPVWLK